MHILNVQKRNGCCTHHLFSVLTLRHLWNRTLREYSLHITVGLQHSPALTLTLYVNAFRDCLRNLMCVADTVIFISFVTEIYSCKWIRCENRVKVTGLFIHLEGWRVGEKVDSKKRFLQLTLITGFYTELLLPYSVWKELGLWLPACLQLLPPPPPLCRAPLHSNWGEGWDEWNIGQT